MPENDLDKRGTNRPDNNEADGSTKPYTLSKREQRRVCKDLYQGCVGEKTKNKNINRFRAVAEEIIGGHKQKGCDRGDATCSDVGWNDFLAAVD